jgi:hypothetical protein
VSALGVRAVVIVALCCFGSLLLAGCDSGAPGRPDATIPVPPIPSPKSSSSSLTPVGKVFDRQALQDGVYKVLTEAYQLEDVSGISCPANQPVKPDSTFSCGVTVGTEQKHVEIVVRDDQGQYQVGAPQ